MTDLEALLRSCAAEPAEDTPRLALADCVEELGHCHFAEFIRSSIALARLPDLSDSLRLTMRVGILHMEHEHEWRKLLDVKFAKCRWERGLPWCVDVPYDCNGAITLALGGKLSGLTERLPIRGVYPSRMRPAKHTRVYPRPFRQYYCWTKDGPSVASTLSVPVWEMLESGWEPVHRYRELWAGYDTALEAENALAKAVGTFIYRGTYRAYHETNVGSQS